MDNEMKQLHGRAINPLTGKPYGGMEHRPFDEIAADLDKAKAEAVAVQAKVATLEHEWAMANEDRHPKII